MKSKTSLRTNFLSHPPSHRPTTSDMGESSTEHISSFKFDLISSSFSLVLFEKAGLFGLAIGVVSFLSIDDTSNMVGLSLAFSCTHNKAVCMHLNNLHDEFVSSSAGSMNSMPFSCSHSSYA